MSTWAEGLLALVVVMGFAIALILFTGEPMGTGSTEPPPIVEVDEQAAARGRAVAEGVGCLQCHTVDGAPGSGPTWQDLAGSVRVLESGESVVADDAYLFNSIVDPGARIVAGFEAIMPPDYGEILTEGEVEDLVEYIKSLSS